MGSGLDSCPPLPAGLRGERRACGPRLSAAQRGTRRRLARRTDSPHDGRGRFDLVFEPAGRKVRVPPGVMLFDAASWNGIAIDSTCGGHGTCRKCKVKILDALDDDLATGHPGVLA